MPIPQEGTAWVDPMDAVINQLQPQPADGTSPVIPEGTPPPIPGTDPVVVPEVPAQVDPVTPVDPIVPTEPDKSAQLIQEIDDLLNEIDTQPKVVENKLLPKEDIVSPKVLENLDNEKITVEERQEIINYVSDLETKVAENDFNYKTIKIERDQLEHMLEKERSKNGETFDKLKELERENKKIKAGSMPDDLNNLVDFYKLNKENNTLYNKRNLVGEACKIIEQITEIKMDDYLMTWLKSGSPTNPDAGGSALDLPPASKPVKNDFDILNF